MKRIKKGDEVIVRIGRDRGKRGLVLVVRADDRVVVQGINMVKRHVRPNPNKNVTGGIVEKEASIHVSNIALVNPATGKGERVGIKSLGDGSRVRFFRKSGEVVSAKQA